VTVNSEIPVIKYVGNGVTTDFPFTWSSGDPTEIYVELNRVPLIEGILYELTEYTEDFGGTMTFNDPVAIGDEVLIYRDTPVTQQVDYLEGEPFPANTHEFQMDKDTRILQEIIEGGRAVGGRVDLEAIQNPTEVIIDNSSGTNAVILPWSTDGLSAGVATGEVIPNGGTPPEDTEPTDKPEGYIWWVLGPAPVAGGDAAILMYTAPIVIDSQTLTPQVARAEFRYQADTGEIAYGYDAQQPLVEPLWTSEQGISPVPTIPVTYWIQFEVLSGTVTEQDNSPIDVWIDAAQQAGFPEPFAGWFLTSGSAIAKFTAAPDDGGGSPDMDFAISRYVTLTAEQT
jgi:hypothetical protein